MVFYPEIGVTLLEGTEIYRLPIYAYSILNSCCLEHCLHHSSPQLFRRVCFDPILVEMGGFKLFVLCPLYRVVVAFGNSPPLKP